jgi:hypothetical protein
VRHLQQLNHGLFLVRYKATRRRILKWKFSNNGVLLPWPWLVGKYHVSGRGIRTIIPCSITRARKKRKYLVVVIYTIRYYRILRSGRYHPVILHKPIQIDRLSCNRSMDDGANIEILRSRWLLYQHPPLSKLDIPLYLIFTHSHSRRDRSSLLP